MSETLTVEEAVGLLSGEVEAESVKQEEAVVEQSTDGEVAEPEAEEVEEIAEEGDEAEEVEAEPVDAPDKWDAEDKAWFAEQPPEVQAKILEQEVKREAVLAKARTKASEEAKEAVKAEVDQVKAVAESLKTFLPKAVATFKQTWGEPDWLATMDALGAEETLRRQIQYRDELEQLQQLERANDQAQEVAYGQFLADEAVKLEKLAPELASDATKQKALVGFLSEQGATPEDLKYLPAWAAALAFDAYRYRNAKAAATAPRAVPKPPVKAAVIKPAAGQALNSNQRSLQQLQNRFSQTKSREDAVALIIAKGL